MADLSCERRLWRALSPLGSTKMATPRSSGTASVSRPAGLAAGAAVVVLVLVPLALVVRELSVVDDPSWAVILLVPVGALVLGAAVLTVHALGSSWWHNGAGHPVLAVDRGVVRGRLRSASRSEPAYDGWDFEVPLASITGVRVTAAGHLAMELPEDLTRELLARPATRTHARQWRALTGSPASWPARRMLRKHDRDERLERLVGALSERPVT